MLSNTAEIATAAVNTIVPGTTVTGTVEAFFDDGDDFILATGGGSYVVDTEPLSARQLGLVPGETVGVFVNEFDGREIDSRQVTRSGVEVAPGAPTAGGFDPITGQGFDRDEYLRRCSDVAAAGVDPWQHFSTVGAMEGRMKEVFDADYYLVSHADLQAAVASGGLSNLWEHYVNHGYSEGRIATPFANPVADPLTQPGIGTISGTVNALVDNDEFLLSSDRGQILVDADLPDSQTLNLNPGEVVSVLGIYDDDDFDATSITRADGSAVLTAPVSAAPVPTQPTPSTPLTQFGLQTISGTVEATVDNDEFVLASDRGRILVDADLPDSRFLNLAPGESVTVSGVYDDDDFDATSITRADGSTLVLENRRGGDDWDDRYDDDDWDDDDWDDDDWDDDDWDD